MSRQPEKPLRIAIGYDGTIIIAAVEKALIGHVVAVDDEHYTVMVPRSTVVPADVVLGKAEED